MVYRPYRRIKTSHFVRRARRGVALRLRSHERRHCTSSSAHSYSTSLSAQHTHMLDRHSRALVRQPQPLLVCFVAPLSRRCRCGRHAHVAGYGTGSRHRLCLGRTHTSVRASGAASRRPARAIAGGGEGGGARPRAADEQLVGGGQGVCALPSRKEGVRGIMRGDARAASRGCAGRDRGASSACRSVGVTAVWGAGRGEQRT